MNLDAEEIVDWIRTTMRDGLHRKGVVVPVSGGIDSTVTVNLMSRALGRSNVLGVFMPERATADESSEFARLATDGVSEFVTIDIGARLAAAGCYAQLDAVLAQVDPTLSIATHDFALVTDRAFALRTGSLRFDLRVRAKSMPAGEVTTMPIRSRQLGELIGAQNLKQRTRMITAYNLAEQRRWAVAGTSNADEIEFGFVVKYGDHAGDLQPLGRLTKADVYELAHQLGVPQAIIDRTPTTDTFSLAQSQDDYYYVLTPHELRAEPVGDVARRSAVESLAATLRRAGSLATLEPARYIPTVEAVAS